MSRNVGPSLRDTGSGSPGIVAESRGDAAVARELGSSSRDDDTIPRSFVALLQRE